MVIWGIAPRCPHSRTKRIPCSYPSLENTPISWILEEKKTPFSTQIADFEYLNTRSRSNVWKPGWKQADTSKLFTPFQHLADLCLKNYPFSDFANSRLYVWEITPFFAEVGTSMVYVLVGCGRGQTPIGVKVNRVYRRIHRNKRSFENTRHARYMLSQLL